MLKQRNLFATDYGRVTPRNSEFQFNLFDACGDYGWFGFLSYFVTVVMMRIEID